MTNHLIIDGDVIALELHGKSIHLSVIGIPLPMHAGTVGRYDADIRVNASYPRPHAALGNGTRGSIFVTVLHMLNWMNWLGNDRRQD